MTSPSLVFVSMGDPSPIVEDSLRVGCTRVWMWKATPEQARQVSASQWVGVMAEKRGTEISWRRSISGYYLTNVSEDWVPNGMEPMFSEIPVPEVPE